MIRIRTSVPLLSCYAVDFSASVLYMASHVTSVKSFKEYLCIIYKINMDTLTQTQIQRIVERHLTNNKRAIENNRKYLQSSTRAKKGHQLRNLRCYYRRKLKQAQIVDSAGKNMTPYINKCKNRVKELSEKLQYLGYRP